MSARYVPDQAANLESPWNVTELSQRDVQIQIPINFVTVPGVSITAACFGNQVYNANAAARCVSNLLSVGFTRLIFDIYWDTGESKWSLCPVQLPGTDPETSTVASTSASATEQSNPGPSSEASSGSASTAFSSKQDNTRTAVVSGSSVLQGRQLSSTSSEAPSLSITDASRPIETRLSVTLNRTLFSQATSVPATIEPLYTIGSYTCDTSTDLALVVSLIKDYLSQTNFALNAALKYLVFNIHAARSTKSPDEPAAAPEQAILPADDDLLGAIFTADVSSYIYTPDLLNSQRENLNKSWQSPDITAMAKPISVFYSNTSLPNDILTSPDGWPSESYMEFTNERRLVLEYGTVDPQMDAYKLDADSGIVFKNGTADQYVNIASISGQAVTQGCFYDANDKSLAAGNSSWATATQTTGLTSLNTDDDTADTEASQATANITSCGISPLLNDTLFNTSADINVLPYKRFVYNSFWSWAPGQPAQAFNISSANLTNAEDAETGNKDFRCAQFNASIGGRWETTFCSTRLPSACRKRSSPYTWMVPADRDVYSKARDKCPDDHRFAVPRTALENRHLLAAVQSNLTRDRNASEAVWIDLNSLDAASCWVTGINATCPYTEPAHQNEAQIVVPIVAGFLIIFVALATLLVKCGSNRSKSKQRRKVKDGWDYEGVPS